MAVIFLFFSVAIHLTTFRRAPLAFSSLFPPHQKCSWEVMRIQTRIFMTLENLSFLDIIMQMVIIPELLVRDCSYFYQHCATQPHTLARTQARSQQHRGRIIERILFLDTNRKSTEPKTLETSSARI